METALKLAASARGSGWYGAAKRGLDVTMATLGLAAAVPFLAVVAFGILMEDGWPVLYRQTRVGRNGRPFRIAKFRSMVKDAEKLTGPVLASAHDPRITRMGRLLRKTAMDELPQLWNILKGDMSFVGPRPERPEFVRRFVERIPGYGLRHTVRPGLTGMAQVYGRYETAAADKLPYDLAYLERRCLLLDATLFFTSWGNTLKARWDSSEGRR
jgi:lipopolysaccharide/colanic/teichoic acid biosynthesis glycosyltransferase